jgi:hypothetical protein
MENWDLRREPVGRIVGASNAPGANQALQAARRCMGRPPRAPDAAQGGAVASSSIPPMRPGEGPRWPSFRPVLPSSMPEAPPVASSRPPAPSMGSDSPGMSQQAPGPGRRYACGHSGDRVRSHRSATRLCGHRWRHPWNRCRAGAPTALVWEPCSDGLTTTQHYTIAAARSRPLRVGITTPEQGTCPYRGGAGDDGIDGARKTGSFGATARSARRWPSEAGGRRCCSWSARRRRGPVADLDLHEPSRTLDAATMGRGVFRCQLPP